MSIRTAIAIVLLVLGTAPLGAVAAPQSHGESTDAHAEDAGDAHAGEHHAAPELDPAGLARHSFNLAVLLAILFLVAKTPVADFLKFRRSEVKEALDSAWDAKTEADAHYKQLEGRLENFDTELQELIAGVRSDAEFERKRILEHAERSSAQLESAAGRTVDDEIRRARTTLRNDAAELSLRMAADILSTSVAQADQDRLNADYLGKIEEAAGA